MKRKQYKVSEAQIPMFDFDHPHMPVLDVSRCEARLINYETAARMVETYHYAHRVPPMTHTIGMFCDNELVGVCAYSKPMANICAAICGEEYTDNVLELCRLFIFDSVGRNSESWLISQSWRFLSLESKILLSYSDTSQSHLGTIYQATNWLYTGTSNESSGREYLMPDGRVATRRGRVFWRSQRDPTDILSWNEIRELYPGVQKLSSSLKHRYVYFLGNKRQRRTLRQALKWPVLPYPKGKQNEIGL